ncbi:hypothetical protein KAX17_06585 [Candidatus Bipolaricaulota bacterium]|nr:hypothetical protein [Candidatus Bipolaricaulota bacterium]MCK4599938.1 hypothetical protein [Candidatus Bipolaricaulota bacterium]
MSEPQVTLIFGDPYRCERALRARHTAILAEYPDTERHTLFGDDLDLLGSGNDSAETLRELFRDLCLRGVTA